MASAREMRLRIRSVKNISQVTRALEAVSAAKVRKSVQAVGATRPYATKAWQVLTHVAAQPGRQSLHPLLTERPNPKSALAIVITSDRGLAGAYNTNIIRFIAQRFDALPHARQVHRRRPQGPRPAGAAPQGLAGRFQQSAGRAHLRRCLRHWTPGRDGVRVGPRPTRSSSSTRISSIWRARWPP